MQKLALVLASLLFTGFGRRVQPSLERLFAESQKLKQQGRRHADAYGGDDLYSQKRQPSSSHSPKFHRAAADVLRAASASPEARQPRRSAPEPEPRQARQGGVNAAETLKAMLQATRQKQIALQEEQARLAREQARIEEREAWLAEQVAWMSSLPTSDGLEVEEEEYPHPDKSDDALDGFWDNRGEFQQY
mmetsp:Transcript_92476/g.160632  ORF Transcript_92476/g.160632 Transcript_92476/m.160632 type:complete len:190 (+) Transcript_92476:98-667(+)